MSTWQIFSDSGNNFRWECSGRVLHSNPQDQQTHNSSLSPLPSMTDLLFQGCSKILEKEDIGMFRTGLGKSVAFKQSSIAKALSILGGDDDGETHARDSEHEFANSLFRTGSGKSVNVSSAGLVRAKTLLGLENSKDVSCFQDSRKSSIAEQHQWQCLSHLRIEKGMKDDAMNDTISVPRPSLISKACLNGHKQSASINLDVMQSEVHNSIPKPPSIKFHTAGGRSLSVSSDALERAKSLLGDPDLGTFLNEEDMADPVLSVSKESGYNGASFAKETDFQSGFTYPGGTESRHYSKCFISPLKASLHQVQAVQSSLSGENTAFGVNLLKRFDAVDDNMFHASNGTISSIFNGPCQLDAVENTSLPRGIGSGINPPDISNTIGTGFTNQRRNNGEKKRLGRRTSTPPFKRPRSSKFTTPLDKNVTYAPNGLSTPSSKNSCNRQTVSTRYPFKGPRIYIKEYFKVPSLGESMLENFTERGRCFKPDTAENYIFSDASGLNCIGSEGFQQILVQSGALPQYASKEWVTNHYKWIVWKLACYERFYPSKFASRLLTVSNVLEELKYRYEREVNHGHRSAIKRILEGDAPPSYKLVLCISAVGISGETKVDTTASSGADCSDGVKVELTDGWYSVDALLDEPLAKQFVSGKLFIGQKLQLWGAGLCGWVGPVSPLEVLASKTVSLSLHINGTYRAHWAERLGFCKSVRPLAFRCIKSNGGPIPQTLVGVTRMYPVLYKEKLSTGGSIVRSERMEAKVMQLYNQRHSAVVEGIISEFQREMKRSDIYNDSDNEEGAKILKILEASSEPEVIMAEMSSEQLTSFASYQAKLEATKQLDVEKAIKKALQDAGLREREVTPFMRVRVVGLTNNQQKSMPKEGLITIWNPTEKQQNELVEGQAYAIAGLLPLNSDSNMLYLQARGSTVKWQPLTSLAIQQFQPFFSPRVSVSLSNMGEVPLSSEFDIAAYVVYVGEAYTTAQWRKQWVFVTDNSVFNLESEDASNSLLAISFCAPYINDNSFTPVNRNLAGTTVGFFNLIKKAKDQTNHVWTAEATENSTYSLTFDSPNCSHLKSAAATAQTWEKTSSMIIDKLKERVLFIVGDRNRLGL